MPGLDRRPLRRHRRREQSRVVLGGWKQLLETAARRARRNAGAGANRPARRRPARALEDLESICPRGRGGTPSPWRKRAALFRRMWLGPDGWYIRSTRQSRFLASLASGKSVLDAYATLGGFALPPRRAGRKKVADWTVPRRRWRWPRTPPPRTGPAVQLRQDRRVSKSWNRAVGGARERNSTWCRRSAAFRESQEGPRSGRQSLSQASAPGRVRRRAGRFSAARFLLPQHFRPSAFAQECACHRAAAARRG